MRHRLNQAQRNHLADLSAYRGFANSVPASKSRQFAIESGPGKSNSFWFVLAVADDGPFPKAALNPGFPTPRPRLWKRLKKLEFTGASRKRPSHVIAVSLAMTMTMTRTAVDRPQTERSTHISARSSGLVLRKNQAAAAHGSQSTTSDSACAKAAHKNKRPSSFESLTEPWRVSSSLLICMRASANPRTRVSPWHSPDFNRTRRAGAHEETPCNRSSSTFLKSADGCRALRSRMTIRG